MLKDSYFQRKLFDYINTLYIMMAYMNDMHILMAYTNDINILTVNWFHCIDGTFKQIVFS